MNICFTETHARMEEIILEISKRKNKAIEEVSLLDILSEKRYIYRTLNAKSSSTKDVLMCTWDMSYSNDKENPGQQYGKNLDIIKTHHDKILNKTYEA